MNDKHEKELYDAPKLREHVLFLRKCIVASTQVVENPGAEGEDFNESPM